MIERYLPGKRLSKAGLAFLAVIGLASCSNINPNPNYPKLIMSGNLPSGGTDIYELNSSCVQGSLPSGSVKLCVKHNNITGNSPGGDVNVTETGDKISGNLSSGSMSIVVKSGSVEGYLPSGSFNISINDRAISGSLPAGNINLHISEHYRNIASQLDRLALIAVLSNNGS